MQWKVVAAVAGVGGLIAAFAACDDSDPGLTSAISSSAETSGSAASGWSTSAGRPCGQLGCDDGEYCGFAPGSQCYGPKGCHPMPPCDPPVPVCGCGEYEAANACDASVIAGGVPAPVQDAAGRVPRGADGLRLSDGSMHGRGDVYGRPDDARDHDDLPAVSGMVLG